jgi:hypothetical protein
MNIAYFVSTTNSYYENTINRLIKEAEISGIPKSDLFFVSSQEKTNNTIVVNNCSVVKVDYTGIHLTPLIHISENLLSYNSYSHICLIHSTSRIGVNFYKNLNNYIQNIKKPFDSLPFNKINHPIQSKDMGLISLDAIRTIKNYLGKIKLKTWSEKSLLKLKKQLILDENLIFGLRPSIKIDNEANGRSNEQGKLFQPTKFKLINIGRKLNIKQGIENSEDLIIKELKFNNELLKETYFPTLDLYKYQRTFQGLKNISMKGDGSIP